MSLFSTAADVAKLSVALNLTGNFGSQLNRATRDLSKFDSRFDKTQ